MKRYRSLFLPVSVALATVLAAIALAGSTVGSLPGLALLGTALGFAFIAGWRTAPPADNRREVEARVAESETELRNRAEQQEAVARLGHTALASSGLTAVLEEAVTTAARILRFDVCSVAQLQPDGNSLLIRNGVGWPEGIVGNATIAAGPDSQSGYTLLAGGPVVVSDFATDGRFKAPSILRNLGVTSGLSVPVVGGHGPFGVLSGQTLQPRSFSQNEINFLVALGNVLATAVERRRATATTEQLAAVVATSSDSIVTLDLKGSILNANAAALRLYGYEEAELLGKPIDLVCTAASGAEMHEMIRRVSQGESVHESETERVTRTGEILTVLVSLAALRNDAGEVNAVASVARDVTAARQAEDLRVKLLAAEETSRVATNLLSTVSHELRTPLTAVRGFASTILDYGDRLTDEEKLAYVQSVDDAARHLEKIVSDLLTLSRIDAGALRLDLAPLNLAEVIRVVIADFTVVDPTHAIEVVLPERLALVDGDISRLRQVLTNLVDNAIKYSEGGPVQVRVVESAGSRAEISVRDHGEGVPEDKLETIFETFYRVRAPSTRNVKGTGLGLAICRGIVQAHGGSIWASLPDDGGLQVTLSLPLLAEASPRVESAA